MSRARLLLLVLAPCVSAQVDLEKSAAPSRPPNGVANAPLGTCLLAGGGKLPPEVFARFVALAGGERARIVVVPTASEKADDPKEHAALQELWRKERAAEVVVFHTRDRERANDEAFCAPLRTATGVWIGGGAQRRLADAYLGTRVERELLAVLARGGVVAGTSAGTAIQTRRMIQSGLEDPVVATGFDLVPGVVIDQHFLKRQRLPRLLQVLGRSPGLLGLGVDEGTAAEVCGDSLRVLGASKAVLVLAAGNGHDEVVHELTAMEPRERALDLGAWRSVAQQRATWSLQQLAPPRLQHGSVVLGDAPGLAERFVALAGGRGAALVGLARDEQAATWLRERLLAAGASRVQVFVVGAAREAVEAIDLALASANGVVFADAYARDTLALLAGLRAASLATGVAGVLARGGVVWGNGIVGELAVQPWWEGASAPEDYGYERALALFPGTALVHRRVLGGQPGDGPITDGAPHEWLQRHAQRLPTIVAIHVEAAAIVTGGTLEVFGEWPTHVLPSSRSAKPGDERERVTLPPGSKWDLVAQKPLGAAAPAAGNVPR